ncbi:MAG: hypothetical protein ACFHVJ_06715 [Aestuariibacter sp.]
MIKSTFLILMLSFGLSAQEHRNVLEQLIAVCISGTNEECDSVIHGNTEKRATLHLVLNAKTKNDEFEKLYISNFGDDRYKKFQEAISVSIQPLDIDTYTILDSSKEHAVFTNQNGEKITIINDLGVWKIDLNNSAFFGSDDSQYRFIKLIAASSVKLSEKIKSGASEKDVFRKAGLYSMVIILPFTSGEQKNNIENMLKEHGVDGQSLTSELEAVNLNSQPF